MIFHFYICLCVFEKTFQGSPTLPLHPNQKWIFPFVWVRFYDIQNKGWHLYEVEPLCRMKRGYYYAEWIANQVVIINYVGVIGGRLGNFISGQTLQNTKPFLSLNKPPFQAFVVPHDSEYRTCFEGEYAKPNGEMSETLLNKGFENYDFAEAWAKAKAQKGDIIYIFDRRKNGNTQRIRKERVKV